MQPDTQEHGAEVGYIVDCRPGPSDYAFFWGPDGSGYTSNVAEAGLYTREEYDRRLACDADRAAHAFVPKERVEAVLRKAVLFCDLRAGREWQRREDIQAEHAAETIRAVFG